MSEQQPYVRPETVALHTGQQPDPTTNARAVPIYQTTSYVFDDAQHAQDLFALAVPGNIYTRIMNPTWSVLEERVAALEGGVAALALASGQAAVTYSVLNIARAGDNIVAHSTLYGGTYNLFAHTLPQYGIEVRFVDPDDVGALAENVDDKTRLVFTETVGNPRLNVVDIRAWADAAHSHGLPLVVDNTVPTPVLARVFDQGADVAVHSATKFIGGHGTTIGGVDRRLGQIRLGRQRRALPGADAARPLLPRRRLVGRARPGRLHRPRPHRAAAQHRRGAVAVQRLPAAAGPGDAAAADRAPQRERARGRQAPLERARRCAGSTTRASRTARTTRSRRRRSTGGYGALVTFGIEGGRDAGRDFIGALRLFSHLANIGDAKSLAIHPATTTHSQLDDGELDSAGVSQDTVRLSVGIEHIDDIVADLDQALAAASGCLTGSAKSRRGGRSSSPTTVRWCSSRARG